MGRLPLAIGEHLIGPIGMIHVMQRVLKILDDVIHLLAINVLDVGAFQQADHSSLLYDMPTTVLVQVSRYFTYQFRIVVHTI